MMYEAYVILHRLDKIWKTSKTLPMNRCWRYHLPVNFSVVSEVIYF